MFNPFSYFKKKVPATETHVVRDNFTHLVIAKGSEKKCRLFISAFALCYMEAV